MIKEEQKSERSNSLEKIRLLANDNVWIETQIEELTNSWSMDYISGIGTVCSRNSFKNSETFEEFIEKAKNYYKDVFDEKKTDQLMIKLFGSYSKEKRELRDFKYLSYYDIISFSREPLSFINRHGEDYSIKVFKACLKITEEEFSKYMYRPEIPDPELVIRTSGEFRISNFLLWEIAYSEFYITDTYWPDFDEKELEKAILSFNKRDRRYGGLNAK